MNKLEIARRTLGAALQLFLDDACPISVHVIAAAGVEIVEGLASHTGHQTAMDHFQIALPHLSPKQLNKSMRDYANAFKHLTLHSGEFRDDAELLQSFTDEHNASLLFKGWFDYQVITGRQPVEVHALCLWVLCRSLGQDYCIGSGITDARLWELEKMPYNEAKRVLQDMVVEFKSDPVVLKDMRIEHRPLTSKRE